MLTAGAGAPSPGKAPAYPCGGTHIADTSQIGTIRVTKIKFRKGELSVSYEAV
ncbi:hypothetical protein MAF45_08760 [Mesosutterella sp. OilRF-GAM-744-9]|uniref:Threonyl/alanyl tRNA synthetase SAD domain-containing protein n=1 Tax=Mesosutterella porci TaxID=2915351 RepID=A0ABS9MSC6_9BURK|nr:hypothetical protein [Mesosutterella sp. oilRF-744-WT-GAM-9]MCG5031531.1 hypothetical protein [Mesosutterella sp. oilRF-744-WT-GAM-9]